MADGSNLQALLSSPSATKEEADEKQRIIEGLQVLVKKKPDFTDFMYGFSNGVEEAKDELQLQGGSYNPKKLIKKVRKSFELIGGANEIFIENVPSNWSPGRVVGNRQYFTTPDNKTVLLRPKPLPPPSHPSSLDGFVQVMDLVLGLVPGVNVLWSISKMVDKAVRGEPVTLMDGLDLVMSVVGSIPLVGTAAKGLTGLSKGVKVLTTTSKVTTTSRMLAGLAKVASTAGNVYKKAEKAVKVVLNGKRVKGVINLYTKWAKAQPHAQVSAKLIKALKINTNTIPGVMLAGTIENTSLRIQTEISKRMNNSAALDFPEIPKITEPVELTPQEKEMMDAFEVYKEREELGYVNNEFFNARIAYYFFLLLQSVIDEPMIDIDLIMAEAYEYAKLEAETGTEAFGLTQDDQINPNQLASALVQVKPVRPKDLYAPLKVFNKDEYFKLIKPYATLDGGEYLFNEEQQDPLANFIKNNKSINKLIDDSVGEYENYGYFKTRQEFIDAIQDDLVNAVLARNATINTSGGITQLNGFDTTNKQGLPLFYVPLPSVYDGIKQAETGLSRYAFEDESSHQKIYNVAQEANSEISKIFKKIGLTVTCEYGKCGLSAFGFANDGTNKYMTTPIDLTEYSHKHLVLLQAFKPTLEFEQQQLGPNGITAVKNFKERVKNYIHLDSQDPFREPYLYEGFVTQLGNWLGPYTDDPTKRRPLVDKELDDLFFRMSTGGGFFTKKEAEHAVKEYFKFFYYGGVPIERKMYPDGQKELTNYRDMLIYSVDYAWVESTTTIPVVFFNDWNTYNAASYETIHMNLKTAREEIQNEATTKQEEEEFIIDSEVVIDDLKDKVDGETEPPPPPEPTKPDPSKEKKELEKAKVKMTKQDEMRLGLDLLKQFQKPKIKRQRIRLYNPNL